MGAALARAWRQLRAASRSGLAVRAAVLLLGAAAYGACDPGALFGLLSVLGVAAALVRPDGVGPGPAAGALVVGWTVHVGLHDPATPRTVLVAVLLSLFVSADALAAVVPLSGAVDSAVVLGWVRRSGWPVLVAVALGAVLAVPGTLPGSPLVVVAGLAGAVGVVALAVRWARQSPNPGRTSDHTSS